MHIIYSWTDLLDKYCRDEQHEWRQEFCQRLNCGRLVRKRIAGMSALFYHKDEVSKEGFKQFHDLLTQHKHAANFITDELMSLLHDGNR